MSTDSEYTSPVGGTNEQELEYSTHKQQILNAQPTEERIASLEEALLTAFSRAITYRHVPYIAFGDLTAEELANAFVAEPIIIKATLACINVAQRAIKRDLGFDFDTYAKSVTLAQAAMLAGYVKPLLPPEIAIPALMELDRFFWTDKEMRSAKGAWERTVTTEISKQSSLDFVKRKFVRDGNEFEIDAAYPRLGDIKIAVDVKRLESPRDFHKRTDEIINKAIKFKKSSPEGLFFAVVYYPFPTQHINLKSRLESPEIDGIFFAGNTASSIELAVSALTARLGFSECDAGAGDDLC